VTVQSPERTLVKDVSLQVTEDVKDIHCASGEQPGVREHVSNNGATVESQPTTACLGPGESTVTVALFDPAERPLRVNVQLSWNVDREFKRDLYLLTVGVSQYAHASADFSNLDYAAADATALEQALTGEKGRLFADVRMDEVLTDDRATKAAILAALDRLRRRVDDALRPSVAVVALSGHGKLGRGGRFFFLPHDYDARVAEPEATAVIGWDDFQAYLKGLRWPVIIVMDTCHSGAIDKVATGFSTPDTSGQLANTIPEPLRRFMPGKNSVTTLAACRAEDRTWEVKGARHGALTLALLEGIEGRRLVAYPAATPLPQAQSQGEPVNLDELCHYATARVKEVAGNAAGVVAEPRHSLLRDYLTLTDVRQPAPWQSQSRSTTGNSWNSFPRSALSVTNIAAALYDNPSVGFARD
jgi:uncharacterized caspase-like protein